MPGHSRKHRSSASFTLLAPVAASYQANSFATSSDSRAALFRSRSSSDMLRSIRTRSRHVCSKRCSDFCVLSTRAFCAIQRARHLEHLLGQRVLGRIVHQPLGERRVLFGHALGPQRLALALQRLEDGHGSAPRSAAAGAALEGGPVRRRRARLLEAEHRPVPAEELRLVEVRRLQEEARALLARGGARPAAPGCPPARWRPAGTRRASSAPAARGADPAPAAARAAAAPRRGRGCAAARRPELRGAAEQLRGLGGGDIAPAPLVEADEILDTARLLQVASASRKDRSSVARTEEARGEVVLFHGERASRERERNRTEALEG